MGFKYKIEPSIEGILDFFKALPMTKKEFTPILQDYCTTAVLVDYIYMNVEDELDGADDEYVKLGGIDMADEIYEDIFGSVTLFCQESDVKTDMRRVIKRCNGKFVQNAKKHKWWSKCVSDGKKNADNLIKIICGYKKYKEWSKT